jgi:antitoxin (DNA-binding transcriptional repressor) of toxin-antitoxin stability system
MTAIPMPEFSRDSDAVIMKVRQGETVVLTDDGKPVVHIAPISEEPASTKPGSLLWMQELGAQWNSETPESRESLTNEDIDRIVYGL